MPGVDWRLFKAQLWQESRFKEDAVSPVGAGGIAQFMPGTWDYVSQRLGMNGSRFDSSLAIPAAAYYMQQQRLFWHSPRPEPDRHKLALCNYNAGRGNCLAAQRLCAGSVLYSEVIKCLPDVTGRHSTETINYVVSIYGFYQQMAITE
jgi:membrane-bound lytic murein transglycosylase F